MEPKVGPGPPLSSDCGPDGAIKQWNRAGGEKEPSAGGQGPQRAREARPAARTEEPRATLDLETWVPAPKVESEKCDVSEGQFVESQD